MPVDEARAATGWARRRVAVAYVIATWFGVGFVPLAPGTAGTLAALPLYFAVRDAGAWGVLGTGLLIAGVGIWAATVVATALGRKDPQIVVVDEVAGVLVALAAAPRSWTGVVAGVVLFRLFDHTKPWPARDAERRLPGGWGIVLDDVAAGAWAAAVLLALRRAGVV